MLVVWFFKCVFHFVLSFRSLSRDCFLFFLFNEKHFYLGVHIEQVLFSGTTLSSNSSQILSHQPRQRNIYSTFKHGKAAKTPIGGLQAVRRDFKNNHETKQQITVARQRQEGGGTYEKIQAMFLRVRQDSIKELPRRPFCRNFAGPNELRMGCLRGWCCLMFDCFFFLTNCFFSHLFSRPATTHSFLSFVCIVSCVVDPINTLFPSFATNHGNQHTSVSSFSRDLIKSLVDQQVSTPEEAMHIATELLHSKLIFPTAKTDDSSGARTFSRKHYYSISEDIAITATKNQRAMIKVRSQLRNLEEMLLEMKEGFSEVDTTRSADMVAINNYVKAQAKYNRALLWALAGMVVGMTSPRANVVDLDVFGLKQYTSVGIGEWIPSIGWGITTILILMFVHWMTKSHKKELSVLSRKLGVGAISKLAMASKRGSIHGEQLQQDMKDINDEQFMKLAMELHTKLQKQMEAASIDVTTGCLTNTSIVPLFYEYPGKEGDETDCWTESPGEMFKVRGPNYLQDGVKIKSRDCAFKLLHVEFFAVDEGVKVENIAGRSDSFAGKLRKEAVEQGKEPPFLLVICFNFPGYAFAGYFQRRRDEKMKDPAFDSLFQKFIENGDDFRDERFKILPGIPPGGANFLVRKTVGNKVSCVWHAETCVWPSNNNNKNLVLTD